MGSMYNNVAVLMSTYNGEKYICEQIESILIQQEVNVKLLIRDDGSSDNTCKIIEEFIIKYPEQVVLIKGDNLGFANSFMDLVYSCGKYDYYAFADQDDIWDKKKLISAIELLTDDLPMLYGSNLKAFDVVENRNFLIYDLNSEKELKKQYRKYIFISNPYGCTMVWNHKLQEQLFAIKKPYELTHDVWVNLVARCTGKVIFDFSHSYINYRVHGNNACGVTPKSLVKRISKYYKFYFKDKKELGISKVCKAVVEYYPQKVTREIETYSLYKNNMYSLIKACKITTKMNIGKSSKFKYIVLILFRKF